MLRRAAEDPQDGDAVKAFTAAFSVDPQSSYYSGDQEERPRSPDDAPARADAQGTKSVDRRRSFENASDKDGKEEGGVDQKRFATLIEGLPDPRLLKSSV